MAPTFRLGRVAGIDVSANWTWLLVVVLLVWSLAGGVFPATNPGLGGGVYLAMAVVATALFFVSLFLHELGHALQARREGVEIQGITLWLFGGVAQFRGQMPGPEAELRIAAAGPAVSLAIGVICLGLAILAPLPAAVDGVIHWLGYINLTLLVFNLIPAFPLDGGRILRALLWRARGDLAVATRIAAGAGRAFGILFIVGGFFGAFFAGAFSGLWLAFIGFFLLTAAQAELSMAEARTSLSGVRVADVMVYDPVTVWPGLTLRQFVHDVFFPHRYTAYPVVAGDEAIGLVSFRDVLDVPPEQWHRVLVRDRMWPLESVPVIDADRDLAEALPELAQHPLHRALVLVDGRPKGLLSITDAARVMEVLAAARGATALGRRSPTPVAPRRRHPVLGA